MDTNPCQLFLWDPQSAAKFCECSRLLTATAKTSLWEGEVKEEGGKGCLIYGFEVANRQLPWVVQEGPGRESEIPACSRYS